MKFFKAMQAPRSAEDEAVAERLIAIASRTKTGHVEAVASDTDESRRSKEPESKR